MSVTTAGRLSRLLALVPWLYANDGITIANAARHFQVSPRQLEADLWLLILCGLPGYGPDQLIDIQFWGEDARIHVIDPQTLERPLRLSGDESAALLIGLRLLAQVPGSHDRAALVSATSKLEEASGRATAMDAVVIDSGNSAEVVAVVDEAIAQGRSVHLRYAGSSRDEITDRQVDPHHVWSTDGRAYLEGWCHLAMAVRTFRVDRILQANLGEPSAAPAAADAANRPSTVDQGIIAEVRLAPEARWALDVYPMTATGQDADGGIFGWIRVHDSSWLVRLTLEMGGQMQVLGPADVRSAVAAAAERALQAYA